MNRRKLALLAMNCRLNLAWLHDIPLFKSRGINDWKNGEISKMRCDR